MPSVSRSSSASCIAALLFGCHGPARALAEGRRPAREAGEQPVDLGWRAIDLELAAQASDVRLLARPEAGVATASVGRAQRAAAGLRHRAEARDAVGDEDAR